MMNMFCMSSEIKVTDVICYFTVQYIVSTLTFHFVLMMMVLRSTNFKRVLKN